MRQDWIKTRAKEVGVKLIDLAEAMGQSHARVSEIIGGRRQVKTTEVPVFANMLQMTEQEVVELLAPQSGLDSGEISPNSNLRLSRLSRVVVRGAVKAGAWRAAVEWDESDFRMISVPESEKFPAKPRFGLLVEGDSMDLEFPEGTILVCTRVTDIGREPRSGEFVIVERYNKSGEIEATCKQYHIDKRGQVWLMPRSSNPQHTPIPLTAPDVSNDLDPDDSQTGITIKAIVHGAYRSF